MAQTSGIQYVVSLDSLDISLLRHHILRPTVEKQLLWSVPKPGREIGLYRLEIAPDTDKNIYESVETYVCHVCNLKVPRMYSNEHNKSEKHETLKKLTEIIIENNTKGTINLPDVGSNNNSDMFFCESCCKAVLVEHKSAHYRTKEHLQSIKNDKLTTEFLKIYICDERHDKSDDGNEKTDDSDEEIEEAVEFSSVICERVEKVVDANIFPINHVGGQLNLGLDVNSSDSDVEENVASSASASAGSINNDFNSDVEGNNMSIDNDFKTYLKTAVQRYKNRSDYLMDDDSVIIVTSSGFTEVINVDTFHNIAYCERCFWFLFEQKNVMRHSPDTEARVAEKICVWKVKQAWTRCLLCKKPSYGYMNFCNSCQIYHEPSAHWSTKHLEYEQFREWLSIKYFGSDNNVDDSNTDDDKSNYSITSEIYSDYCKQFIALGGSKSKCRLCHVNVPYFEDNIIDHVEGKKHKSLLQTLFKRHKIEETSSVVYHCGMCNAYTVNFMDHIEKNIHHKNWMRLTGEIDKYKLRKYVYDSRKRCKEATVYQNVYEELLQQNNIHKLQNGKFFCTPCGVTLNRVSEIFHMYGNNHWEGSLSYLSPYKI